MTTERRRHADRERLFFFGDIHFPHADARALATAENICRAHKPDRIVILGDLIDCYAVSRFDKDPSRVGSLQEEFDQAKTFLARLRAEHPDAEIEIKEGNHEERIQRYLWSKAPELSSLRCLTVAEQLGLEELRIKWIPAKARHMIGDLVVTHGTIVRQRAGYTAHGELFHWGRSGISGHTHRMSDVARTTSAGTERWIEAGCLCSLEPEYGADRSPDWQQGVVVGMHYVDRDKGIDHLSLTPIRFRDGIAEHEGRIYGPDFVYAS